jgi:broad specificity phosphatase PhoE
MTDPTGSKTLALLYDLRQQGIENYTVLMRHAERPIDSPENDLLMQITEDGKRAAYEFGRGLPADSPFRFFASPVDRCVETADFIEKGALSVGSKTESTQKMERLYAFYIHDLRAADGILYEMFDRGEWAQFFRNWFDGKYPAEIIGDARPAAEILLKALQDLLQQPTPGGNICVSHDINLFLIKEYYLGLRPEDHEYIQFLEGVIVYERDGEQYIVNHQTGAKKLPV